MPHISPLPYDANDDLVDQFVHYRKTRGFIPNSILTMQRRPQIATAFMALNQAVLYEGTVSEELKMLVSLISSQASGCRYCQAHMANLSSIYSASAEKISAVWQYEKSTLFSPMEKAALSFAFRASVLPNAVEHDDFEKLRQHFSEDEIVEITASVALFGYLNRWNDTMATEIEELPRKVASEILSDFSWETGKHEA